MRTSQIGIPPSPYVQEDIYRPLQLVKSPGTILLRECLTLIREGEKQQEGELSWETVQKREEEMRKDWSALQKLKKEKREAERSRREAQTTAEDAEERASDDELRSDEEEDTKPRQTKWSAECASTLPNFNIVRENSRTVEEWCKSTKAVLAEYWGACRFDQAGGNGQC